MANISISDLSPAGSDLFTDFNTFLRDLDDNEFSEITGGFIYLPSIVIVIATTNV